MNRIIIAVISIVLFAVPCGAATTYYVDNSGCGDCATYRVAERDCGSGSETVRDTIAEGFALLSAGDTLYIRSGTFSLTVQTEISTNGTLGNRITISGYTGETVILDGANLYPPVITDYLLKISGDYIDVTDLDIKNTKGSGLLLNSTADYARAYRIDVVSAGHSAIIANGTGQLIDTCTSTDNGWRYYDEGDPTWGSAIAAASSADTVTIQGCTSYLNGGEGINSYGGATGTTIQDCVAYDNQATNLYLDSTTNVTLQRNLFYRTGNQPYGGTRSFNIYVGEEYGTATDDLTIINNFCFGGRTNLVVGSAVSAGMLIKVANNTFVNAVNAGDGWNMGVYFIPTSYGAGSIFANNIIRQDAGDTVCASIPSTHTNLTFSYNMWSDTQGELDDDAEGTGDIYNAGTCNLVGGTFQNADHFKINGNIGASYPRDKGTTIPEVTEDYWGTPRLQGLAYDMGGHEVKRRTGTITSE